MAVAFVDFFIRPADAVLHRVVPKVPVLVIHREAHLTKCLTACAVTIERIPQHLVPWNEVLNAPPSRRVSHIVVIQTRHTTKVMTVVSVDLTVRLVRKGHCAVCRDSKSQRWDGRVWRALLCVKQARGVHIDRGGELDQEGA